MTLTNPGSGLASDFLNHYNEILLLVENLPVLLPDMVDAIVNWRPVTYEEYFHKSQLPGSASALMAYRALDADFKDRFEATLEYLNGAASRIVAAIEGKAADGREIAPDEVSELCAAAAAELREVLSRAVDLVNHGRARPVETAQAMADRMLDQRPAAACR